MPEHSDLPSPDSLFDALPNAKSEPSPPASSESLDKPPAPNKYDTFFRLDAEDASPEAQRAINRYTYETFNDINQVLREGVDANPNENDICLQDINDIQNYLTSNSFPEAVTLHRGTSAEYLKFLFGDIPIVASTFVEDLQYLPDADLTAKYSESIFTIDGFISTSVDPDVALEFLPTSNQCILVISAPKGTQGRFIANISSYFEEQEVLLPHHTCFQICQIQTDNNTGIKYIYVTVLNNSVSEMDSNDSQNEDKSTDIEEHPK